MNIFIRNLKPEEYPILKQFLYLAIFVPEGETPPPQDILNIPELQVYIEGFGQQPSDLAVTAQCDDKLVGAAWARIMDDYGHIYDGVPSLAISLLPDYRGMGIGKRLLAELLRELRAAGFRKVTLAVQKENYVACKLYQSLEFQTVAENEEEFLMLNNLT